MNAVASSDRILAALRDGQNKRPLWWHCISENFRARCQFIWVPDWELSRDVLDVRAKYLARFDPETVNKRIPRNNWRRADICAEIVPSGFSLIDIGSGLGEFVNVAAIKHRDTPIASVDIKDYQLWFDFSNRIDRIYESVFDLSRDHRRDIVTCFEVIEHLPPERLGEAVRVLRSLAKRKLLISVPFLEPPPIYRGHFTRFDCDLLDDLFPDAKFTVFGKGAKRKDQVLAWIMCEIDV